MCRDEETRYRLESYFPRRRASKSTGRGGSRVSGRTSGCVSFTRRPGTVTVGRPDPSGEERTDRLKGGPHGTLTIHKKSLTETGHPLSLLRSIQLTRTVPRPSPPSERRRPVRRQVPGLSGDVDLVPLFQREHGIRSLSHNIVLFTRHDP